MRSMRTPRVNRHTAGGIRETPSAIAVVSLPRSALHHSRPATESSASPNMPKEDTSFPFLQYYRWAIESKHAKKAASANDAGKFAHQPYQRDNDDSAAGPQHRRPADCFCSDAPMLVPCRNCLREISGQTLERRRAFVLPEECPSALKCPPNTKMQSAMRETSPESGPYAAVGERLSQISAFVKMSAEEVIASCTGLGESVL